MAEPAIVVHGGAGRVPTDQARIERMREGAASAIEAGHAVLAGGGSALDAVEAAVVVLEDDPVFNAGRGAALTSDGGVELDASVMEGTGRASGAVACVTGVRNPVRATVQDLRGNALYEALIEGDAVTLDISASDLMQLRVEFS